MDKTALIELIARYKADSESVYNTWFINGEERIKAFRAIRRGVRNTVDSIATGTFPNDFKGSPLEVVLTAITEQKQVFEGAAHPYVIGLECYVLHPGKITVALFRGHHLAHLEKVF
jgi:type II restriction enzyme